jgi:hypothetical protein
MLPLEMLDQHTVALPILVPNLPKFTTSFIADGLIGSMHRRRWSSFNKPFIFLPKIVPTLHTEDVVRPLL